MIILSLRLRLLRARASFRGTLPLRRTLRRLPTLRLGRPVYIAAGLVLIVPRLRGCWSLTTWALLLSTC